MMNFQVFLLLGCIGSNVMALKLEQGRPGGPKNPLNKAKQHYKRDPDLYEGWDMDEWDAKVAQEIERLKNAREHKYFARKRFSTAIESTCNFNAKDSEKVGFLGVQGSTLDAMRNKIYEKAKEAVAKLPSLDAKAKPAWLIVDKQLYIKTKDLASNAWDIEKKANSPAKKHHHMKQFIISALEATCEDVPDVAFGVDIMSTGSVCKDGPYCLAIAQMKDSDIIKREKEVLVPNCYFDDVYNWETFVQAFKGNSYNVDWSNKVEKAFWRGTTTRYGGCDRAGNKERLEAAVLTSKNDQIFDMAVTNRGNNNTEVCYGGKPALDARTRGREQMAAYKYLVNLPGSQAGSYSRNINHLFLMNSVVAFWESQAGQGPAYDEWYMPALMENVTHININAQDAEEKINNLKLHDEKARQLAGAACSVFEAAFSPCSLTKHFQNVFSLLKAQQTSSSFNAKELLKQGEYTLVSPSTENKRQCICKGYDRVGAGGIFSTPAAQPLETPKATKPELEKVGHSSEPVTLAKPVLTPEQQNALDSLNDLNAEQEDELALAATIEANEGEAKEEN